jgi:hypothetical protein
MKKIKRGRSKDSNSKPKSRLQRISNSKSKDEAIVSAS